MSLLLANRALLKAPGGALPSNPVGYYPFLGNANDESGNGNNGTVSGATLTVSRESVADNAYNFNTTPGLDHILLNSVENLGSVHSIHVRTRIDKTLSRLIEDASNGAVINQAATATNFEYAVLSTVVEFNTGVNNIGNYVDLTFVRNGTSVNFYLDGVLTDSPKTLGNNNSFYVEDFGGRFFAGSEMDGVIDMIVYYDRILTQEEITNLVNFIP